MSGLFDGLSDRIKNIAIGLKKTPKIQEIHISDAIEQLRKGLLEADVHFKVAKDFCQQIKTSLLGKNILQTVNPQELFLKTTYEFLVQFLGSTAVDLTFNENPTTILMMGLQGAGKTTHTAKLGYYLSKQKNKKVLLVAGDTYRAAAMDQLQILGQQNALEVFVEKEKNPLQIATNALEYAKKNGHQVLIFDSAGRTALDAALMEELAQLKKILQPQYSFFVLDAVMGQEAVNVAREFEQKISFDRVILTKMDEQSGARAGAALSIKMLLQKNIQFIGTGEKIDTLQLFHPDRIAGRILGQGDILTLIEQINQKINLEETQKLQKKLIKNGFDCNVFLEQINQIRKMGDLSSLMGMMPGMGKMAKGIDLSQDPFKEMEAIIFSMTPAERVDTGLFQKQPSRLRRIAKGAGTTEEKIKQFLKQMEQFSKMMKMINGQKGGFSQLMGMMNPGKLAQMQSLIKK